MIYYQNFESPVGPMIGGTTDNGLCFLEWHDRGGVERILERVSARYQTALVEQSSPHLASLERELKDYFAGGLKQFRTPIDIKGTPFEMKVWRELLAIPYGVTRSYGEMAERLDKKGAARAVGRANGANYLAIIIPCHRVLEASGKLRGYGGGLWRKQFLLDLESGIRQPTLPLEQTARQE